jgi:hypothetical protein
MAPLDAHSRREHRGALLTAGDLVVMERWSVKLVLCPVLVTCGTELTVGPVVSMRGQDLTVGRVVNRVSHPISRTKPDIHHM